MTRSSIKRLLAAIATAFAAQAAHASIAITQVDPYGSSSKSGYSADWFVLTNTGTSAVDISGWTMLDNHAASNTTDPYAGTVAISNTTKAAAALTLASGSTIAAGQSVIFLESQYAATSANAAAQFTSFLSSWYGGSAPTSGLVFGTYNDGASAAFGLSQTADMVNVFNGGSAGSTLEASVAFGADNANASGQTPTFLNLGDQTNVTLTAQAVAGTGGAIVSFSGKEVGIPGLAAPVATVTAPVPEPEPIALMGLGLGIVGFAVRRRKSA